MAAVNASCALEYGKVQGQEVALLSNEPRECCIYPLFCCCCCCRIYRLSRMLNAVGSRCRPGQEQG